MLLPCLNNDKAKQTFKPANEPGSVVLAVMQPKVFLNWKMLKENIVNCDWPTVQTDRRSRKQRHSYIGRTIINVFFSSGSLYLCATLPFVGNAKPEIFISW